MKDRVVLCALCALLGCKQATVPETEQIALYYATAEQSKTDVLTQGDQIGIFAAVEGRENYFLENAQYVVGSDGKSLSSTSAVYYPEAKQAVAFAAYLPFGGVWSGAVGTFSVPTDQSTTLKQADLCWAKASSTPVATPVPLEFAHKMAHLLVQTNTPTAKITIPNAFSGGTLDIKTGVFTPIQRSSISTTGTELILPAQTVTRLILTVAGVEYVFEGAISLETAKTTTVNLTLNPSTKTATLSGSSTTNWLASTVSGNPTQAVSNILTMHWPNYVPQGATPDKVVLTINNNDYTVSSGITYDNQTFTVPFASSALRYPYTITKIAFQNLPPCTQLLSATIYKSSASTLGIKDLPRAIKIGNLWWATGNLVAVSKDNNHQCTIGEPTDGGLYFQFGSLIGYKGGAQSNGGTGIGIPQAPLTTDGSYWNGSFSWANDAMVWPTELVGTKSSWTNTTGSGISTLTDYYFNYSLGWATAGQDIRTFAVSISGDKGTGNLASGRYAKQGVGDPCSYYLGGTWRLPSGAEYAVMCNNQTGIGTNYAWSAAGGSWVASPVAGGNFYSNKLFSPATGYRHSSNGSFYSVTTAGYGRSSSVYSAAFGLSLSFNSSWVYPQQNGGRSNGFPVRCVATL